MLERNFRLLERDVLQEITKGKKMKTKYTKKQIQESIKHWQKVLENLNEAAASSKYLYVTKANPSLAGNARKAGASGLKKLEDPNQFETLENKLARYST